MKSGGKHEPASISEEHLQRVARDERLFMKHVFFEFETEAPKVF